ncbi:MAG: PcfB family protein [Clostridia bacterium]|nr:PcfB family protein [Clostridia bacterium]
MNYSGEAAEQVVRMSLNGVEVAAKISGKAAERLAILIFAILRDQKKTKGKTRLTNMLKSGKELSVFAVMDSELQKFCEEAKKYGVLYCVLKDRNAKDGITDIMVREEDAGKINRIFERFHLSSTDMGRIRTEIQRESPIEEFPVPERTEPVRDKVDEFLEGVIPEQPNPTAERSHTENPTSGRTTKSHRSEPSSAHRDGPGEGAPERPSVRRELEEIRLEQRRQPDPVKSENPIPELPKKGPKEVHK